MIQELNKLKNPYGYDKLKSFQIGGSITEDKKKELLPFFVFLVSQEINPEKYGKFKDTIPGEEWSSTISVDDDTVNKAVEQYKQLSEENLAQLEAYQTQYIADHKTNSLDSAQFAAKGAKLKKLNLVKKAAPITKKETVAESASNPVITKAKGGTTKKKKKCSCGCDMILTKAAGGKVMETCSCKCGGKLKKKK